MIADYLTRLRGTLALSGSSPEEIENILQSAHEEIDSTTRDLVANALENAQSAAEQKDANEFLDQITLNTTSGYLEVSTESGQLDFSTPPTPMLPWLLKNGKTSKRGTIYAAIPIGKSNGEYANVKDVGSGASAVRREKSNSMADSALEIAASFGLKSTKIQKKIKDPSPVQEFRMVTSEQDPSTQWVKKAKDKDLRSDLDEINHQLRSQIEEVCREVCKKYGGY